MTDPKRTRADETDHGSGNASASELPVCDQTNVQASDPAMPKKVTEAEQMALYEKDLMENDWGHQPC